MLRHFLISSLLLLAIAQEYTFEDYIQQFDKTYLNEQEFNYRKNIFITNYNAILQWNSHPDAEYKQKVTIWTDRTHDEIKSWKKVSLEQLPPVNTNLKVNSASHISEKKVAAPTSVDWRKAGKVTDAKQQGSCGSCWAFSSTAAAESYIAINGGSLMDLSEEYVLECTSGSDCTGGYVNRAMSLIVSGGGQPTQSSYPYKGTNTGTNTPRTSGICQTQNKISLPSGTYTSGASQLSNQDMKTMVATAPVAALFYASDNGFASYASGTYSCRSGVTVGDLDHAVEVVGYDSSGNYIVKNSWGRSWGEDGFATINKDRDCGLRLRVYYFAGANGNNNNNNNNNNSPAYDNSDDGNDGSRMTMMFMAFAVLLLALLN